MNIFDEVQSLNLPIGEYAVVGGGVMAAHGLREHHDVDLIVTPELFKKLVTIGWEKATDKENVIRKGNFEADSDFHYQNYRPNQLELIENADLIRDIPFIKLSELLKFKEALGREKDKEDIELIKKYLI